MAEKLDDVLHQDRGRSDPARTLARGARAVPEGAGNRDGACGEVSQKRRVGGSRGIVESKDQDSTVEALNCVSEPFLHSSPARRILWTVRSLIRSSKAERPSNCAKYRSHGSGRWRRGEIYERGCSVAR